MTMRTDLNMLGDVVYFTASWTNQATDHTPKSARNVARKELRDQLTALGVEWEDISLVRLLIEPRPNGTFIEVQLDAIVKE